LIKPTQWQFDITCPLWYILVPQVPVLRIQYVLFFLANQLRTAGLGKIFFPTYFWRYHSWRIFEIYSKRIASLASTTVPILLSLSRTSLTQCCKGSSSSTKYMLVVQFQTYEQLTTWKLLYICYSLVFNSPIPTLFQV
jgi:hypothetical protein